MDANLDNLSETSKLLSVKKSISSDIFSLFSTFGLGHILRVWDHGWVVYWHGRRYHGTYAIHRVPKCIERLLTAPCDVLGSLLVN